MPINWNKRKYSEQEFIDAWNTCNSIAQVAKTLNLNIYGSTYTTLKDTAKELKLTKEHMTGKGHLKGKKHNWSPTRSDEEVFVIGKKENNKGLKKRLVENFKWELKCFQCNNSEWLGQKIALELDHINGNNKDNRIENLKFLCPNCHAQTPTYRGKNMRAYPSG